MAIIGPIEYNADGTIRPPGLDETLAAKRRLETRGVKEFPTFDIGYHHIFRMEAFGLSFDQARERLDYKRQRFFRKMNMVEGFRMTKDKAFDDYVPINQNFASYYEAVYVIEDTGTTTQNPDSPYPEYQQDLQRLLPFKPETVTTLYGIPQRKRKHAESVFLRNFDGIPWA